MMARGSRNRREEEQEESVSHMSDPMYDEEEGFEEEGDQPKGNIIKVDWYCTFLCVLKRDRDWYVSWPSPLVKANDLT